MKKKTRRKLKKALKSASKALQQLDPELLGGVGALATGGATAGAILRGAVRDPRIKESARELVSAIADFVKRAAAGDTDQEDDAPGSGSLERH
jgi:hypothetical protein